jgi:polyhydroxyalkanoate synthase subunit PhaC
MARNHRHATLPPPCRQGPRPLPLYLLTEMTTLLASHAALPFWKRGSMPWKPSLADAAEDLKRTLDAAGADAYDRFGEAVATEALARTETLLAGIEAYRRHPYRRDLPAAPVLWQEGTTRLLDYRDPARPPGQPVLVVPSLINRAYVLDLTRRRSLMRYLAGRGLAPFLVDWDAPGAEERAFSLDRYVAGRLETALDRVRTETGRPVAALGYCMGGLLALALAQRRPDAVNALVLLATPWDFHAGQGAQAALLRALAPSLGRLIDTLGEAPVDLLQMLFASLSPTLVARKFSAFGALPQKGARARDFVALEDWANDGVPLAARVARDCLFGWYGDNTPARGAWRIAGQTVRPEAIRQPTLALVPAADRIVPPDSALPLAHAIPCARIRMVRGGHVGMLLGARAKTDLYGPLARWLEHLPPKNQPAY